MCTGWVWLGHKKKREEEKEASHISSGRTTEFRFFVSQAGLSPVTQVCGEVGGRSMGQGCMAWLGIIFFINNSVPLSCVHKKSPDQQKGDGTEIAK